MEDIKFAAPVKYMPIRVYDNEDIFDILDTCADGAIVVTVYSYYLAYKITKFLNESEGYVYEP